MQHIFRLPMLFNSREGPLNLTSRFQRMAHMEIIQIRTTVHSKVMDLIATTALGNLIPTLGMPLRGVSHLLLIQAITSHTGKQNTLDG